MPTTKPRIQKRAGSYKGLGLASEIRGHIFSVDDQPVVGVSKGESTNGWLLTHIASGYSIHPWSWVCHLTFKGACDIAREICGDFIEHPEPWLDPNPDAYSLETKTRSAEHIFNVLRRGERLEHRWEGR